MSVEFTEEEQAAHDAIITAFEKIQAMGLLYNVEELTHAVHTMQQFVSMHYLHRIRPDFYADWYGE